MNHFAFLAPEWTEIHEAATKAEAAALPDPRTACFHARRGLELIVHWLYKFEAKLKLPYDDGLSALIHEPSFKLLVGEAIFAKARVLVTLGNRAVHNRPVAPTDGPAAVKELFHVACWRRRRRSRW